ncbi:30S ribosomal protein S1 [bacterium]|nr:30S ribosomal protein S1 [bacterium]
MSVELISNEEYEKLLSEYDYKFQKGDLVCGQVCGYDSEGAIVDIGAKTCAVVPTKEAIVESTFPIEQNLLLNEKYEFLIIRDEDEDGKMLLSYKRVANAYKWRELEELKAQDAVVQGVVIQVVRGGIIVEVKGIRGFVPSSHLRSKDATVNAGDLIDLKILTMDASQSNFILSNRKVYAEQEEENASAKISEFEINQVIDGTVVRLTDFGAFIDVGGLDGLLPLSQISWKWVEKPSDVLKLGEKIKVQIISIDYNKKRVSLSLKNLEPDPWETAKLAIKEGDIVEGVITRLKPFGAFVEVYSGVEALLPSNEVVKYQNKNSVILNVGDKLKTTIVMFNPDDRRISLGLEKED